MTKFEQIMAKTGQQGIARFAADQLADLWESMHTIFPYAVPELSAEAYEKFIIDCYDALGKEV